MEQLFYIVGFIVLIIIAQRVMSKVKDVPKEDLENIPDESEELLANDVKEDEVGDEIKDEESEEDLKK